VAGKTMKILLIGKNGQVGWELQRSLSTLGEVIAVDFFDKELCGDLTNLEGIAQTIRQVKPDVVVNAAAHTAVDKAESERELSQLLNADSVEVIAKESALLGALLVHYSTDYVFNGEGTHFRLEDEDTGPLNTYGETKLAGEIAVASNNPRHFIFRTSWVFATRGANFAKTMLRLAKEKEELSIINDQFGAPTGAELLADCTAIAIRAAVTNHTLYGTYHLVASGETTWYDYAQFVFDIARDLGESLVISNVKGIDTSAYPTPAKRPLNSRLSNLKFQRAFATVIPDWTVGVKRVVTEILGK
jgi:dTDP-4-dehydrorhamnose reductase